MKTINNSKTNKHDVTQSSYDGNFLGLLFQQLVPAGGARQATGAPVERAAAAARRRPAPTASRPWDVAHLVFLSILDLAALVLSSPSTTMQNTNGDEDEEDEADDDDENNL